MAATLKDVSKLAGVAPCTVSYVLSGKAETMKISASTVRKVLDAARKLNYRANLIAKNLRRQQTRTVGVVFNDLTSSWTDEVTAGIYDVLLEADYQPFLGVTYFDAERERRIINTFLDNQVEGLILQPLHASAATVRRFMTRETFRNLSILIFFAPLFAPPQPSATENKVFGKLHLADC